MLVCIPVFGDDGLRVGLLKVFADPFLSMNGKTTTTTLSSRIHPKFDYTTTRPWIAYFARHGLSGRAATS